MNCERFKSLKFQNDCLPGWDMDFVGLMSSSGNSGSRTDIGLGRSGTSTTQISRFSFFLLIKESEGDSSREHGTSFSSNDSWEKNKNSCYDKIIDMEDKSIKEKHRGMTNYRVFFVAFWLCF